MRWAYWLTLAGVVVFLSAAVSFMWRPSDVGIAVAMVGMTMTIVGIAMQSGRTR
jgi:hypothetical protein